MVYGVYTDAYLVEAGLHFGLILIVGEGYSCIGHEGNLFDTLKVLCDLCKWVAEILFAGVGGVADKK